jgi:hypothetical protein
MERPIFPAGRGDVCSVVGRARRRIEEPRSDRKAEGRDRGIAGAIRVLFDQGAPTGKFRGVTQVDILKGESGTQEFL